MGGLPRVVWMAPECNRECPEREAGWELTRTEGIAYPAGAEDAGWPRGGREAAPDAGEGRERTPPGAAGAHILPTP